MMGKRSRSNAYPVGLMCIWFSLSSVGFADDSPANLDVKLKEAEKLAVEDKVDAAIDAYEALLLGDVDFADLRYNLGTLYLQHEQLGPSVLHLKTALRLDPTHADAKHNLQHALSLRKDSLSGIKTQTSFLFDWIEGIPPGPLGGLFCFFFILACVGIALYSWLTSDALRAMLKKANLGLSVGALLSGALLMAQPSPGDKPESVVMENDVLARKGPSMSAAVSLTVNQGLFGTVVSSEGDFDRLRLENGFDVWVPRQSLMRVGERSVWAPQRN